MKRLLSIAPASLLLLFLSGVSFGADESGLSGGLKNMGLYYGDYFSDLTRFTLRAVYDDNSAFHAETEASAEFLAGGLEGLGRYDSGRYYLDLDYEWAEGGNHIGMAGIDRAFVSYAQGPVRATAGRQRIAWGTGFVWNPTDLFNPTDPLSIEQSRKNGIDAVHASFALGTLSRAEAAFAPGRGELGQRAGGRVRGNIGAYDISAMGGEFEGDSVIGGDFAGYLGGAGFRGEFSRTRTKFGDDFIRAAVNLDYIFSSGYYAMAEFYFNGRGEDEKEDYDPAILSGGGQAARHYSAVRVSKEITPLLSFGLYGLGNLDDASGLISPSITYSIAPDLDLALGAYVFGGKSDTDRKSVV